MSQVELKLIDKEAMYDELIECLYSKWKWSTTSDEVKLGDAENNFQWFKVQMDKRTILRKIGSNGLKVKDGVLILEFFRSASVQKITNK